MFSNGIDLPEQGWMTHKSLFALFLCQILGEAFSDMKSSGEGQGEWKHEAMEHSYIYIYERLLVPVWTCVGLFSFFSRGITVLSLSSPFKGNLFN